MGLWETRSREMYPCLCQGDWARWFLSVYSNPNYDSMIFFSYDSSTWNPDCVWSLILACAYLRSDLSFSVL